jgi:hypothetical protein
MAVYGREYGPPYLYELVPIALQRLVATRCVGLEPPARLDRGVGGLLDRLDRASAGRVDDDSPLATAPRDACGPVFVVMPPPGLALLTATPRAPSERFWPALIGLAFVPSDGVEVIHFHRAFSWAIHLIGNARRFSPMCQAFTLLQTAIN